MRHCHAPGKPACTSTSDARTNERSAPPRACTARSSSGRGAQPATSTLAVASSSSAARTGPPGRVGIRPRRSSSVDPMASRLAALRAPAPRRPARDGRVDPPRRERPPSSPARSASSRCARRSSRTAPSSSAWRSRPTPAGPKPAVLANLNEAADDAGRGCRGRDVHDRLGTAQGCTAGRPGGRKTAGRQVGARGAVARARSEQHYLQQIAATATLVIPRVIDYLETVPDVDASRLAITGGSTNGFIALQAVAADTAPRGRHRDRRVRRLSSLPAALEHGHGRAAAGARSGVRALAPRRRR